MGFHVKFFTILMTVRRIVSFDVVAKSGVAPSGLVGLVKHIRENCPNLNFKGLMTIGAIDNTDDIENENFKVCSYEAG